MVSPAHSAPLMAVVPTMSICPAGTAMPPQVVTEYAHRWQLFTSRLVSNTGVWELPGIGYWYVAQLCGGAKSADRPTPLVLTQFGGGTYDCICISDRAADLQRAARDARQPATAASPRQN